MTPSVRHYFGTSNREFLRRASALVAISLLFSSLLCAVFAGTQNDSNLPSQTPNPALQTLRPYISFLDSRFDVYFSHETFSQSWSRPADYQRVAAVPPPTAQSKPAVSVKSPAAQHLAVRPALLGQNASQSSAAKPGAQSAEAAESPSDGNTNGFQKFFAKLFGKPSQSPVRFAYAAADDSQLIGTSITSRFDEQTAVYDISAHKVYMPDGTQLEAHSGFGRRLDDPTQVAEKDLGPTPPNAYSLELREQPFHGVQALRLIPEDEQKALGRTGLLAHTFMLGPNGQSNGCVSFKDYAAFLHAYLNRRIKRLVVVASLN